MKYFNITLLILFTSFSLTTIGQNTMKFSKSPFSIGETVEIHSKILDENRILNIYLPNGYTQDSTKKFPVIYLLDGSVDEDFIHIAGLVQFGSFSWINMLPESIVVGISNIDRKRDFTFPTNNKKDKKDFPTTGSSEKFINFIEKELQPFVNTNYKTNSIKTIIGQSLGGLLATEILFKNSDLFDNYILISPSLWWDDESLLKFELLKTQKNKSIYIGVGKEGEIMERTVKELYKKLNLFYNNNTNLFFNFFEKQNHGDALHLAVYDAFETIFKTKEESSQ